MKMESGPGFQAWFESEMEWTRELRKRKVKIFWKCIAITLGIAAAVGLVGYLMEMGSDPDAGLIVVAAVIFSVLLVTVIVFFAMLPGFRKGSYARKIRRAMTQQGFDNAGQERFAQEQLSAQHDPSHSMSMEKGQDQMPTRFTMGEHYACLTGGEKYGPYIIKLDGTESIRVGSRTMNFSTTSRASGLTIRGQQRYVLYTIQFMGGGKEQDSITLNDRACLDMVLDVLRRRFPIAVG